MSNNELFQVAMQLRGFLQNLEYALTYNLPIQNTPQFNEVTQMCETLLNLLGATESL